MKKTSISSSLHKKDFGFQYIKFNDLLITEYLNSIRLLNPDYLLYGENKLDGLLEKRFFAKLIYDQNLRNTFNKYWKDEEIEVKLKNKIYQEIFENYFLNTTETKTKIEEKINDYNLVAKNKIREALEPYKGKIIYYAYNVRFLKIALPILSKLKEEVIILTYEDIPETFDCPNNIMIVEFPVLKTKEFTNDFLELKFPLLYYLFNNLEFLIKILKPKSIIVFEGANVVEYNMLALIGKKFNIPTICIQHGWPGLLYSGFSKMQFDYFLSWGNGFTKLLKPTNPEPKYISSGYPYEVYPIKNEEKNAISFFFQGPYFVSTLSVIEQMVDFSIFCAIKFPEYEILIREHPSTKINSTRLIELKKYKNIKFVPSNKFSLKEVLTKSILSVSVFSSTLMESMAYNSIPFIFNLTSMPNYNPNLNKVKLGIEVKTLLDAKEKIVVLLASNLDLLMYRKNLAKSRSDYFLFTGEEARQNIVNEIIKISNKL